MELLINILFVLHFGYHAAATIGGVWSLLHSHNAHKRSWWKIALAFVWLALSILLLVVSHDKLHHHEDECNHVQTIQEKA